MKILILREYKKEEGRDEDARRIKDGRKHTRRIVNKV